MANHRRIGQLKKRKKFAPTELVSDGKTITDLAQISETFNDFFASKGKNLAEQITPESTDSVCKCKGNNGKSNSLFLSPTAEEVQTIIVSLSEKKAVRVSDTDTKYIKYSNSIIAEPLSDLLNECVTQGTFPDSLKIAEVVPIHKKGEANKTTIYRPISLLSPVDKIYEKLLYNRLILFLEKYHMLSDKQFGFRRGILTTHAVTLIHNLVKHIDNNEYSCCVFLDLTKAFDTVDHNILIKKLETNFGIRGAPLHLFENYLQNRHQYVKISNSKSNLARISCGVPQGSSPGLLFFLMCINDIPNCSEFDTTLFADDTYLTLSDSNLKNLEKRVNKELQNVGNWVRRNKLSLNFNKTNYMIINKQPAKTVDIDFNLTTNGVSVEKVHSVKYLGVVIDDKLTWAEHLKQLSLQLARYSGIFYRLQNVITQKTLIMLY